MANLAPQTAGLCSRCKAQNEHLYGNFDFLASEELPRSHRVTVRLGSLKELVSRGQKCSFCSLAVLALSTAWGQSAESLVAEGWHAECTLCNRVVAVIRRPDSDAAYKENFQANEYRYANCRLEIECKPAPPGHPSKVEIQAIDSGPGINGLFDGDAPLFTKRPSEKMQEIDFRLLKGWLFHCKDTHGDPCRPDTVTNASEDAYLKYFRLIDVIEGRIVDANSSHEYVALSYVWGRPPFLRLVSSSKSELYLKGRLDPRNKDIPKTIQDAMQVVERLNMRYLWVDALCIMQDDPSEKAQVIGAMDLIYSRALLTIVAASGSHANAGLAGLEPGSRDLSPFEARATFPESSREFVVARASPSNSLRMSPWNSRGWTYQERLCSHRLLIFTEQQVVYLCGKSSWCEDTVLESDSPHIHYEEQPLFSLNLPNDETPSFMKDVEQARTNSPMQDYGKMVDEYSSRNLTYPGDILDAFTGGLRRFQQNCRLKGIEVSFLFGLPTTWFELGLLWNPEPGSRRWERRDEKWRHPSGAEVSFPSWSWMGWMGKPKAGVKILGEFATRPEIDWYYVEPGSNSIVRLSSSATSQSLPPRFSHSDSPRELQEKWKPPGAPSTVTRADLDQFNMSDLAGKLVFFTSTCFLPLSEARKSFVREANDFGVGTKFGKLFLDPTWAEGRIGQSFEFVVFGRHLRNGSNDAVKQDMLYIMLVERRDAIAYRVGVGRIEESAWIDSKPTWQLVVLA